MEELHPVWIPRWRAFFLFAQDLVTQRLGSLFASALMLLLLAYLLAGKGIAYLGIGPLYISEVIMALGCVCVFVAWRHGQLRLAAINHPAAWFLILFMFWGAARTLPFIPLHHFDALRDGVIWGYAVYAFCIALLISPRIANRVLHLYSRALPYLLVWLAIVRAVRLFDGLTLPGAPIPLLYPKASDIGVHLAGAGAFLLLRLDRKYGKRFADWQLWLMWVAWGIAWIINGSISRGAMISALIGLIVATGLRPRHFEWLRPVAVIAFLLGTLFLVQNTNLYTPDANARRQVSTEQLSTNLTSIFGGSYRTDHYVSIEARLLWWQTIAAYTLQGPYLLIGKGYGVNLMIGDGIAKLYDIGTPPNRHPHNITMNILARSGLSGLVLWLVFLVTYGWQLFRATLWRGASGRRALWLLAYLSAFLFCAHVDVFFEGPMGGIWFWSLIGISWSYQYKRL